MICGGRGGNWSGCLEVEIKRAFFVYLSKAPASLALRRIRSRGLRQGETSEAGGTCFSGRMGAAQQSRRQSSAHVSAATLPVSAPSKLSRWTQKRSRDWLLTSSARRGEWPHSECGGIRLVVKVVARGSNGVIPAYLGRSKLRRQQAIRKQPLPCVRHTTPTTPTRPAATSCNSKCGVTILHCNHLPACAQSSAGATLHH